MQKYSLFVAVAALALGAGCRMSHTDKLQQEAVDHFVESQLALDDDETAALAALYKAVEADPYLATAHAAIGDIYRKRGDHQMAVRSYERAVTSNAWNFRNHYNCGSLHQVLAEAAEAAEAVKRHLHRAIELYQRAAFLNAADYDAKLNLGVCHYQLEDLEAATRCFRDAIELDDSLPDAYTNMGAVYDRLGQNFDAILMYNKSLERDPLQPQVLMNLGAVYTRQQKWKSAARSYRQALELDPDSAEARHWIGHCLYYQKDYDKAVESYQAALELDARRALTHRALGVVYLTQYLGDRTDGRLREKALEHWRTSLTIDPGQPDLVTLLDKYAKQ